MILPTSSWRWIFRLVFLPFGLCLTLLLIESIFIFLFGTYFNFKHIVGVWPLIPSSNRIWPGLGDSGQMLSQAEGSWQEATNLSFNLPHVYGPNYVFPGQIMQGWRYSNPQSDCKTCASAEPYGGQNRTIRFLKVMADKQAKKRGSFTHIAAYHISKVISGVKVVAPPVSHFSPLLREIKTLRAAKLYPLFQPGTHLHSCTTC